MIGKVLGGRYEIIEEVGKGGMAVVYKAKCLLLNRIVAVKVLRNELEESEDFLRRFNTEAQAAASLSNQNIMSVYDVGKENGAHYIVMEYIEGVTLKEYIRRTGKLSWQESLKIAVEISNGLSAAHSNNIVHRDIKPQNIMVTDTGAIKVADFGIARAATSSTMTADNDVLGSVYYFSPEQARGGYVDKKTDIYSLGVVLYEMLTGKVPYDGASPVAVAMKHIEGIPESIILQDASIPKCVEDIVFKAMEKDTLKRYQSVDEMKSDLLSDLSNPDLVVHENDENIEGTRKIAPVNYNDGKKTSKKNNEDKKAVILAVITSVILVSIFAILAVTFLNGGFGTKKYIVPSFVGMTLEQAEELADKRGFNLIFEEKQHDGEENIVLEQNPSENQVVTEEGYEIMLTISKKEVLESIVLEDYIDMDHEEVKKELEKLGLVVSVELKEDENFDEGNVIMHYPEKGDKVEKGDTVILFVSRETKGNEKIDVPDLTGMTRKEAEKALENVNLKLGKVEEKESDIVKGTIISYSPIDSVEEDTAINVVISKGKEEHIQAPARTHKTLSIDLSAYSSEVEIKIVSNGKTVHSSMHDPSKTPMFSATLSGNGVVSFNIYIDGKKVGTRAINFDN